MKPQQTRIYFQWSRDLSSHNALTQAIEMDRSDIVKLLLSHSDIDPNQNGFDGFTPLCLAVSKGSVESVRMLLGSDKTDVNLREGGGMAPLHLAILYNNYEIAKLLLSDNRTDKEAKLEGNYLGSATAS